MINQNNNNDIINNLGFQKNGAFIYDKFGNRLEHGSAANNNPTNGNAYAAFTSQELQELINEIDIAPDTYFYSSLTSEAQHLAAFYIYLLENKK